MKPTNQTVKNIFYALPRVASVSLFAPIHVVQGIYAKHYGLALTTIASIVLFARLFDAITDPVVGYLSDKSKVRRGTRKPTMIIGAFFLITSAYFLYSPPGDVSAIYFAFWFMAFYLGYTLFEIPHLAWGGEISQETLEKNQTYTLRTVAGFSGLVLFYTIPLLPIWERTDITPDTLELSAVGSALLMFPLLYLCIQRVPDGSCYEIKKLNSHCRNKPRKTPFWQLSKTVINVSRNKPLLLFFSAFLFAGSGVGMWYGLVFIYVDAYLGVGALFAKLFLIALMVSIPGAFIWLKLAKFLGKKYTWQLAMLFGITSFACTEFLGPENVTYWTLLILLTINSLCLICIESLPQSMLSEIIDYSTWKFRTYQGSTYFALYLFIYKATIGVGGALGLAIAGWYGFDPSSISQTSTGITGLKLAMTWVPTLLVIISMIFIALSPINARRHRVINRRLEGLKARLEKE